MSDGGTDGDDPFRIDGAPTQGTGTHGSGTHGSGTHGSGTQGTGTRTPADATDVRAMVVRVSALSVGAVAAAFVLPPLGVLLGVLVIVAAARAGAPLPRGVRRLAYVAATGSIVVGLAITVATAVFRTEISTYTACMDAANTNVARANCQDALSDALSDRLGL